MDAAGRALSRLRAPLDTTGGRATTTAELDTARRIVRRSGVLDALGPAFENEVGRPRTLPLGAFLVAAQLNALARHHVGHLVEIARVLNALTGDQRARLGIASWDPEQTYDRVERLFLRLCDVLEGDDEHGPTWFANALANAAIPDDMRTSASVAVDGTDVETWGALHGDPETVALDGEAAETQQMDAPPRKRKVRKARVFGVGPDGRNVYTKDADARAGHRSATNSRSAGPYIGYEAHLAVQTRDVRWTNGVDKTTLGPEVPGVITAFNLVPAGTHRGNAIVAELLRDPAVNDVVWDPGYSLCRPETAYYPLAAAGVHATFQPVTHQRGVKPFGGHALLIDGALFSPHLPEELRDLPVPPRGSSLDEKLQYEARFNVRARWRYTRHAGPDADGATRWRCPFCSSLLRSRQLPKTMRNSRVAPLVALDTGTCCDGTITAQAGDLPLWQRCVANTTAWRISMGRRQVVESANAALKGAFVDLGRGFTRVFGRTKTTVLIGFTLAAYNIDRVRSFRQKHRLAAAADEPEVEFARQVERRAKRRRGTWSQLLRRHTTSDPPNE